MKWRYKVGDDWNKERYSQRALPKRSDCKYCYGRRDVYYLHDDFVSGKTKFGVMMVCSRCTYHLAPIEAVLSDSEMQALVDTPLKTHEHGSITNGATEHPVSKVPVMPYGFVNGKPVYPARRVLNNDLYTAIEELGVVPSGFLNRFRSQDADVDFLLSLYRRARIFRQELDAAAFRERRSAR